MSTRSTTAAIATGVVLLGGVAAFGIGLPKVIDTPGASVPSLPDNLGDDAISFSKVTPELIGEQDAASGQQLTKFAETVATHERDDSAKLAQLYAAGNTRYYAVLSSLKPPSKSPKTFFATVIPGEPGLVVLDGTFQTDSYVLKDVQGYRCAVKWSPATDPMTGQPAEGGTPDPASYTSECRTERDGLTYSIYSTGMTEDETADYLGVLLEKTA